MKPYRVAIVGSRDYYNLDAVREWVKNLPEGSVVVSGGARGPDRTAEEAARDRGLMVESIRPDWNLHGMQAGFLRNSQIVATADIVVAFWDGQSRGTKDTIDKARASNRLVIVVKEKA